MMRDQQLGAPADGLVDHRTDRVDGEQHRGDFSSGISADQAHGVPGFGPGGVVKTLDHLDEFGETHVPQVIVVYRWTSWICRRTSNVAVRPTAKGPEIKPGSNPRVETLESS